MASSRHKGYIANYKPQRKTRELLAQVDEVLATYAAFLPLTLRQIFYRLVGQYEYAKNENAYNSLSDHLSNARRGGRIDWSAMRDDGMVREQFLCFDGEADFLGNARHWASEYRRDRQAEQAVRIEVWCEAAGMIPQLRRVADDYTIPVLSGSGYDSVTAKYELSRRALLFDGPTLVLHLGDYDPDGEGIFESTVLDAAEFVEEDATDDQELIGERVALTEAQVIEHGLPTAPPKEKSSRTKKWEEEGKSATTQLEALDPATLAEALRSAIEAHLDLGLLADQEDAEDGERAALLKRLR